MPHSKTAQAEASSFMHGGQIRLFCALAAMAGWLLWIEHRAPAASLLSCAMFGACALWHRCMHPDARPRDEETAFAGAQAEVSR